MFILLKFAIDFHASWKMMLYYKKLLCKSIKKLCKFHKPSLKSFANLYPEVESEKSDTLSKDNAEI
jgi:hypothetical protein